MEITAPPLQTGNFSKFMPFRRVEDAAKSGAAPTVWGLATFEQPDLDNEICDYASAKAAYTRWSEEAAKRTTKAGQSVSFGNIRLQHGLEVGGKVTKVGFEDKAKEVWLGSEPINEEVHQNLKDGFYTGYSQGGSYAWRKCAKCDAEMALKQRSNFCENCDKNVPVVYGLAAIVEVSYVDVPCTDEGFEYVKANGSRELVKFKRKEQPVNKEAKTKRVAGEDLPHSSFAYVGDPEDPSTWKLPIKFSTDAKTKSHIRNALARFDQTKGIPAGEKAEVKAKIVAAAKEQGIDVSEKALSTYAALPGFIVKRVDAAATSRGFQKGLYQVGCFAEMLTSLGYLYRDSVYERDMEGDDSEVPEQLAENLEMLIDTFLAMAEEEAKELAASTTASTKTTTGENTVTAEELQKQQQDAEKAAKKVLAMNFAKTAVSHDKLAAGHTSMADRHDAMSAAHKAMLENEDTLKAFSDNAAAKTAFETFHKAAIEHNTELANASRKTAKASAQLAEMNHKLSEAADAEEHTKTVKEAEAAQDPAPATKTAPVSSLDTDVAAEAARQRNSPEYKDAITAIAKTQLEVELAELRKKTVIPDGVRVAGETGAAAELAKAGLHVIQRETTVDNFTFASVDANSQTAGL